MKKLLSVLALFVSISAFAGQPAAPANPHAGMSNFHGGMGGMGVMVDDPGTLTQHGKVLKRINVPSFTYLEVAQEGKNVWLAISNTDVKKGDKIRFDKGRLFNNFYSKTLKRTFHKLLFVHTLVADKDAK